MEKEKGEFDVFINVEAHLDTHIFLAKDFHDFITEVKG